MAGKRDLRTPIVDPHKLYNRQLIFVGCTQHASLAIGIPVASYKLQKKLNSMHTVQNLETHCFTVPSAISVTTLLIMELPPNAQVLIILLKSTTVAYDNKFI